MEARLGGSEMADTRNGGFLRYFKLEYSLPMSTTSGHGVVYVIHVRPVARGVRGVRPNPPLSGVGGRKKKVVFF